MIDVKRLRELYAKAKPIAKQWASMTATEWDDRVLDVIEAVLELPIFGAEGDAAATMMDAVPSKFTTDVEKLRAEFSDLRPS